MLHALESLVCLLGVSEIHINSKDHEPYVSYIKNCKEGTQKGTHDLRVVYDIELHGEVGHDEKMTKIYRGDFLLRPRLGL